VFDWAPFQDVYANLLASGVQAVASRVVAADRRRNAREDSLVATGPRPGVSPVDLAEVPEIRADLGGEHFRRFLLSADARDIVAGLGVAALAGSDRLAEVLERRFAFTMSWYLGRPEHELADDAGRIFASLRGDVEALVTALPERASGVARRELLSDALAASDRVSTLFTDARVPDFAATERFQRAYRTAVRLRLGRLEPPTVQGSAPIPLDALYVEPRFRPVTSRLAEIGADELRTTLTRTVVLGHPGAGKSSFARSVCHAATAPAADDDMDSVVVPFFVELRAYAVQRRERGLGVVDFIEHIARSTYQTPPPPQAVEYLLQSGRAILIFDGLDELHDLADRKDIRTDVETIATLFPFARILVTSRERGYLEAPLDERLFDVVGIRNFSDEQVAEYVTKWFTLDGTLSPDDRSARIEGFLSESTAVADLRKSPLLLALMCGLYRRLNYIPKNRADVYQDCADMLFDRWDRGRKIEVARPIEAHLQPALQHIAQWIFADQTRQAGVTHSALVEHMEGYILTEVTDDRLDARAAAEQFVSFCHGRGWVLVPSGTEDGEELYAFAHRTFLEFFTAAWLSANSESNVALAERLYDRLSAGEWEIVALLAFQLRSKALRPAGNEMFERLVVRLEQHVGPEDRGIAYLMQFGTRVLDFFAPNPGLMRRFAAATTARYIELVGDLWGSRESVIIGSYRVAQDAVDALLRLLEDSLLPVRAVVIDVLTAQVAGDDDAHAAVAADLLVRADGAWVHAEPLVSLDLVREHAPAWLRDDVRVAPWAYTHGFVTLPEALELSGPGWIFTPRRYPAEPATYGHSIGASLVDLTLNGGTRTLPGVPIDGARALLDALEAVRDALVVAPPPWATQHDFGPFDLADVVRESEQRRSEPVPLSEWSSSALLGFLLLLAGELELSNRRAEIGELLATREDGMAGFAATFAHYGIDDPAAYGLLDADAEHFTALLTGNVALVVAHRP
jgi:hypothetical protein